MLASRIVIMTHQQDRREFLEQLGVASAAILGTGALPVNAAVSPPLRATGEPWDMSWLDRLKQATYRAVIDANVLEEGYATDLANGLLGDYHDVHGTSDDQVRIVIVARRAGTPLVLGDAVWEKFPVGEDTKMNDRDGTPYRRNPFYRPRPGASPESAATKLESLQRRGVILLVCNIALHNWARGLAERTQRDAAEVKKEVFANLVPGTTVMPSGVFALMRAQNAGCAYMRGQ
jgi:intracellular sulfur oxidation DsrE/DsrF family protein